VTCVLVFNMYNGGGGDSMHNGWEGGIGGERLGGEVLLSK